MPKLASGWFKQRGNYFGFGDYDPNSKTLLLNKDLSILNKAVKYLKFTKNIGKMHFYL